jgi:hypothetical protein
VCGELEQGSDLLVLVGQIANLINRELNRVKQQSAKPVAQSQLQPDLNNVKADR